MEKKMTKAQMFAQIIANYNLTNEEKAFIEHEIELVNKKNSSKSDKPTKTQIENEGYKATIAEVLATNGNPMLIAEIRKAHPDLTEFSSPKLAALLKQLVSDGKAIRIEDGRKVLWTVA